MIDIDQADILLSSLLINKSIEVDEKVNMTLVKELLKSQYIIIDNSVKRPKIILTLKGELFIKQGGHKNRLKVNIHNSIKLYCAIITAVCVLITALMSIFKLNIEIRVIDFYKIIKYLLVFLFY